MLKAIVRFLEKTNNIDRSTYIWNTVSATVLAMQGPVIQAVVSRTNGATDLGIFSIAFSIATLMMYVGQYGIRRFQASDVNEQFSFEEYHGMRIITCIALVIASFALSWLFNALKCFAGISSGIKIILLTVVISLAAALLFPTGGKEDGHA